MNLESLESFLEIYEQGSLSKAAELLYLTQPALSSRLAALEEELGVSLIERKKGVRGISFTKDGLLLAQHARKLIELDRKTKLDVQQEQHRELKSVFL